MSKNPVIRDEKWRKVREILQDLVDIDTCYISYDEGNVLADQCTDLIVKIFEGGE